jgi:hypothetical protein
MTSAGQQHKNEKRARLNPRLVDAVVSFSSIPLCQLQLMI